VGAIKAIISGVKWCDDGDASWAAITSTALLIKLYASAYSIIERALILGLFNGDGEMVWSNITHTIRAHAPLFILIKALLALLRLEGPGYFLLIS